MSPVSATSPYNEQGYIAAGLRDGEAGQRLAAEFPAGLYVSRRTLPPGILVIENYLSAANCERLLRYVREHSGRPSTVQAADAGAGGTLTRLSADRVTDYIEIDGVADQAHTILRTLFSEQVEPHYGTRIEWYEEPELLRYRSGGHYAPHADAENWDPAAHIWKRAVDRDFSVLLYLNSDFSGGSLSFPNFGLRLAPAAGMLVVFPSDHRYLHSAEPLTAGERAVLVSWCAARGTTRVADGPPHGATMLK